jgi:TRAP-type uncharacterized transport system substrate-binding protein
MVTGIKRPTVLWVLAGIALLAAVMLAIWLFDPPQRRIRLAAGPLGSVEYRFAERYKSILEREGVTLELVATRGALESLARLQDPQGNVDAALMEGGSTTAAKSPDLVSLGTLYYRPVWVFYRGDRMPRPGQPWPHTLRIALGPEGGDSASLSRRLLVESGADFVTAELRLLDREAAADSMLAGTIDIAAIVAPWEASNVQQLLRADSVHLAGFERAEARVALHPELTRLTLPEGVVDLARNIPDQDVPLVAPKMSLAARRSLHPALQYLLLDALSEVHGGPGIFQRAGQFPAAEAGDLPLSKATVSYHKSGTPFLQRHLPFWVAAVVTQVGLLLIPILGIAYPVLQGAPAIYATVMQHRVSRVYSYLKSVEVEMAEGTVKDPVAVIAQLDALDARARKVQTTAAYMSMVYTLRAHIQLVRDRLLRSTLNPPSDPPASGAP